MLRPPAGPPRAGGDRPAGFDAVGLTTMAILVVLIGLDVRHLGYFADDFHFLDVARRVPLPGALDGHAGLYPWYRPLSREAFFALIASAGAAGPWLARGVELACVFLIAWLVRAIGLRLLSPRAAAAATLLFLGCETTRFLAGWASGFQDLLALALGLLSARAQLDGRRWAAIGFAFAGLFAKESGVLAFGVLALITWQGGDPRGRWRWIARQAAALAAGVAIHAWVRATWQNHGAVPRVEHSLSALLSALVRVGTSFVGGVPAPNPDSPAAAVVAFGAALAWMLAASRRVPGNRPTGARGADDAGCAHPRALVAAAAGLGCLPLVLGHATGRVTASEYYAFSAFPWLALLLGHAIARFPRAVGAVLVSALVAWNTMAFHYRPVDLSRPEAWRFERWSWREAARLSAIADRFHSDVRGALASRPESLVVLLSGLENGCYYQTEDGPAVREALRDPTVRAWWLQSPPYRLEAGRFEILAFNAGTRHLERHALPLGVRNELVEQALARGNGPTAWALAAYGDSAENARFEFRYYRAAAALLEEGPPGFRRELGNLGLVDTAGPRPRALAAAAVGPASPAFESLARVLGEPRSADAHAALAKVFALLGAGPAEAMELRIAVTLDPSRASERATLAARLVSMGEGGAASGEPGEAARLETAGGGAKD